jgi:hypothetical protein
LVVGEYGKQPTVPALGVPLCKLLFPLASTFHMEAPAAGASNLHHKTSKPYSKVGKLKVDFPFCMAMHTIISIHNHAEYR